MIGMLLIMALLTIAVITAIVTDGIRLMHEYKHIKAELKSCNELIHGYTKER